MSSTAMKERVAKIQRKKVGRLEGWTLRVEVGG
jgi:hypothetical protein